MEAMMSPDETMLDLLRQAQDGSRDAFSRLVARYELLAAGVRRWQRA